MDTLTSLRQLIALADTQNFRIAGEQLGVSHSAVSQTIKKLEQSHGVALFDRSQGKTVPTAFGERLIASARRAVMELDGAGRDIKLMENFATGRLVIGVDPLVSESLLSLPMTKMMNSYPALQFTVRLCNRADWEDALQQREIDIYFGLQPDREVEALSYRKLTLQPPSLMCRAGHPLEQRTEIDIADLRDHAVIGGDVPDWFLWRLLEAYPDAFSSLQDLRATFLTSQDFGLLRQLVLETNAIAVLPDFVVRHELKTRQLRRIKVTDWPFEGATLSGVAAWNRERPLPPSAQRLLSDVQQMLDQTQYYLRIGTAP